MVCNENACTSAIAAKPLRKPAGFSMLELLIVVAMGLVIAALTVPNVYTAIGHMRLRSAANSLSGLIQDARIRAVKRNSRVDLALTVSNSARLICVDENTNGACDATERTIQFPNTVSRLTATPSGTGAPGSTINTTAGITNPQLATMPSFNPRGLPCRFNSGTCTTNNAFAIYLQGDQPFGNDAYAVVTVTPSGRVKVWNWGGSAWGD